MSHDLIARYIYAVTRHLPTKARPEVEQELDSLISDMLAARCGDIMPSEKDIHVVLTELGNPEELAAKYSGDENKSLIGGIYYLIYKRVLWIVLPIAVVGIAFANILTLIFDSAGSFNGWELFGGMIGGAAGGAFQAFAIVTIIFAILAHKKVKLNDGDILSNLPPVPQKSEQIKPHDPIINMLLSVCAAVFFIGFPQFAGAWSKSTGWVPLFDVSIIRSLWLPIALWAILSVSKEIVKLIEGRFTKRLAFVTLFANILIFINAAVVLLNSRILNPNFILSISDFFPGDGIPVVSALLSHAHLFFLGGVLFALILETAVTAFKAWKFNTQ